MKTQYDSLERATVKVSNANDEARKYAITAEIQVNKGIADSFSNGKVMVEGKYVATFDRLSKSKTNVSFNDLSGEEQCEVLAAINNFIKSVEELVVTKPIEL